MHRDFKIRASIYQRIGFEVAYVIWILAYHLPPSSPLFINNTPLTSPYKQPNPPKKRQNKERERDKKETKEEIAMMASKGKGGPIVPFLLGAAAATVFLVFIFSDQKARQPLEASPFKTKHQFAAPLDSPKFEIKINKTSIQTGNRVPKKQSHANQVGAISLFFFLY